MNSPQAHGTRQEIKQLKAGHSGRLRTRETSSPWASKQDPGCSVTDTEPGSDEGKSPKGGKGTKAQSQLLSFTPPDAISATPHPASARDKISEGQTASKGVSQVTAILRGPFSTAAVQGLSRT